jgi:thioesterase domain-containing protein
MASAPARNLTALAPLSPAQLGMLIETLGSSERGVHVEQLSWPLRGAIEPHVLESAWASLVDRCEVLRTGFVLRHQGEPLQFVVRAAPITVEVLDLTSLDPRAQPAALGDLLAEQRERGFELDRPPLMRLALIRCADDLHHFAWTFHHLILDGWSIPLLAERASLAYEALLRGCTPARWESRPYREFVTWLGQQPVEDARDFWCGRLGSAPVPTALGAASRDATPVLDGHGFHELTVDSRVIEALERDRRFKRVTLAAIVQCAWALLLAHYSGEDEVVFGATVSGRPPQLPGVETMVGMFINTIPLALRVPAAGDLWDWLSSEQERRIEEQAYEHCSTGQIHGWLELPGTVSLFDSILVFENYPLPQPAQSQDGLASGLPTVSSSGSRTSFPLAIMATPGDGLRINVINRRRMLDDRGGEIVIEGLRAVLEEIARAPHADLATVRAALAGLPRPTLTETAVTGYEPDEVQETVVEEAVVAQLQALWQELLDAAAPPDPDANFFEIGGHSLLALRLVQEIRGRFGAELALGQVFERPTIRGLAALLPSAGAGDRAGDDLLVLLHPGLTERPLFLAPPGAGTPICYATATAAADTTQAIYGFQTPGLGEAERPLRSVAAIADCLVASIRRVQPAGPYRLGGWSFGAMIAWEAASILQADGEQVESLILIDADVEDPRAGLDPLRRAGGEVASLATIAIQVGVPRSWSRLRLLAQLVGVGLPASPLAIGPSQVTAGRRSFASWYANVSATSGHEPGDFDGEVTLIRGIESRPRFPDPLQTRLSERTRGRVRVHTVPGNHMTMMLDPANAEKIGEAMAEVNEPGARRRNRAKPAARVSGAGSAKPETRMRRLSDKGPWAGEVRVIAFDGTEVVGGTGYVAASLLGELRERMSVTQRECFLNRATIFAGTSAGSANALFFAMETDPDVAFDRLMAFWVESEQLSSRQSMSVFGLARAVVGLGPLLSMKKLRAFYLSHFGMMKLGDLPHKVVIPSTCLERPSNGRWGPTIFSNLDQDGPDLERLVVDVLLSSSSPPLLTPVYQSLAGDGPGYVDGGLWANNPSMAAIASVVRRRGTGHTDGFKVLSISNGQANLSMRPRFHDGFGNVGYFGWLLDPRSPAALLNLIFTVDEERTSLLAESLLLERFCRLDPEVPGRMLQFTPEGIERCVEQILQLDDTHRQLDDTMAWLNAVDWFGES